MDMQYSANFLVFANKRCKDCLYRTCRDLQPIQARRAGIDYKGGRSGNRR